MIKQRKFILIAAAAGIVSVFLPWITVSAGGFGISMNSSVNGFHGFGVLVFLAFLCAGAVSFIAGDQSKQLDKTMWLVAISCGIIALLGIVISFSNSSGQMGGGFGLVEAGFGFGIWIAMAAAAGVIASAWLFKNPEDSFKTGFESLKKSIPLSSLNGPQTNNHQPQTSRIDELERLIELKNKGEISEEEYKLLKAKLL